MPRTLLGDHEHLRVEEVEQESGSGTEQPRALAEQLDGPPVTVPRGPQGGGEIRMRRDPLECRPDADLAA
jgi:hypothetical protein